MNTKERSAIEIIFGRDKAGNYFWRPFILLAIIFAFSTQAVAASGDKEKTALTIYSSSAPGGIVPDMYRPTPSSTGYNPYQNWKIPGYAVVKNERSVFLEKRRSNLRFTDVAAYIDPTTVTFSSLTDPGGTSVLEQNFQFDLVNQTKLMERYIDREITVEQATGDNKTRYTGTLLSSTGGVVTLKGADGGIKLIRNYSNVILPDLPSGLITRPTLMWDIVTKKPGKHRSRVTYQTEGITWWADYNAVYSDGANANSGFLDISAWVSIINKSGATYKDSKLKLVAGEVHRAPAQVGRRRMAKSSALYDVAEEADSGFAQKSFFEYHLYTLGRRTTLPDNSTKQIELFPSVSSVPVEKLMVYAGAPSGSGYGGPITNERIGTPVKSVDIFLKFKNDKKSGVGMPLPAGRVRVSKLDRADGTLEFIGEDVIKHTPKDEDVLIKLGKAFDVVGERTQIDFKVDSRGRWLDETIEIKIRNHKEEPVTVLVKERLYRWTNWEISGATHKYEKKTSRVIHFPVKVKKDGETVIRYKVHYSW